MNTLIIGATGAIGTQLVQTCTNAPDITKVITITRHPTYVPTPKIENHVLPDFNDLSSLAIEADAIVICIGTTKKQAGSKAKFEAVDLNLVVNIAKWAHQNGIKNCHVVSSIGAAPDSKSFYLKVKGNMEKELQAIGFNQLHIYRPSLLVGTARKQRRLTEEYSSMALTVLSQSTDRLSHIEPIDVRDVALGILNQLHTEQPGRYIHQSTDLFRRGTEYSQHVRQEIKTGWRLAFTGILSVIASQIILLEERIETIEASAFTLGFLGIALVVIGISIYTKNKVKQKLNPEFTSTILKQEARMISSVITSMNRLLMGELAIAVMSILVLIFGHSPILIGITAILLPVCLILMVVDSLIKAQQVNYARWLNNNITDKQTSELPNTDD